MIHLKTIRLGDEVKDVVTGLTGIAVARTEWLNGCVRISVQPTMPKTRKADKPPELYTVDVEQLRVVTAHKVTLPARQTGGDHPNVAVRPVVTR